MTVIVVSQIGDWISILMNKLDSTINAVGTTGSSRSHLFPALDCASVVSEADATEALPPGF